MLYGITQIGGFNQNFKVQKQFYSQEIRYIVKKYCDHYKIPGHIMGHM